VTTGAVIGDLQDPSTLKGAFVKGDRVFLLNGVTATELQEGLIALSEAKRAGAERIVYLSVHDVGKGPHLPHFASKISKPCRCFPRGWCTTSD